MKGFIRIKRMLAALIAIFVFVITCMPAVQAQDASENEVIRVGYMDYKGFIEPQSDGTYTGYGADYLAKIAQYTGYKYEYVYGEWTQLLKQLAAGEIDFLCTAQYTEERAQVYDYSAYPIGYSQGLLYTCTDSELCYEDFKAFDGMTVGVITDSAMNDMFSEYAAKNNFTCSMKEYNSEEELVNAVNTGEVDAICSEHLANHTDLSLLAKFGADAYYILQGQPIYGRS